MHWTHSVHSDTLDGDDLLIPLEPSSGRRRVGEEDDEDDTPDRGESAEHLSIASAMWPVFGDEGHTTKMIAQVGIRVL